MQGATNNHHHDNQLKNGVARPARFIESGNHWVWGAANAGKLPHIPAKDSPGRQTPGLGMTSKHSRVVATPDQVFLRSVTVDQALQTFVLGLPRLAAEHRDSTNRLARL
jgi:hypothetical protein